MPRDKLDRKLEVLLRRLVQGDPSSTTPRQLLLAVDGRARKGRNLLKIRERLRENNLCTEPDWETCDIDERVKVRWLDPGFRVDTELIAAARKHNKELYIQQAARMRAAIEHFKQMERERARNAPSMLTLILKELLSFIS